MIILRSWTTLHKLRQQKGSEQDHNVWAELQSILSSSARIYTWIFMRHTYKDRLIELQIVNRLFGTPVTGECWYTCSWTEFKIGGSVDLQWIYSHPTGTPRWSTSLGADIPKQGRGGFTLFPSDGRDYRDKPPHFSCQQEFFLSPGESGSRHRYARFGQANLGPLEFTTWR